ncbi:hypothetical protein AYI68_g5841 [Smittium mucronatum]|uniref:Uncharacterized protein n=1 Tax=Smittium mucronatum TaxID=133383 RepID=A0A1R0GT55_9FUNG|nr:hypothetical protein AYI68_g5841 [Smittium mucronatum]
MAFLQTAFRRCGPSDCRTLDFCTRLCLSCAKRSAPPVSGWSSSGIAVLRIAVRCLYYSQPRIVKLCVNFWSSVLRKVHYYAPKPRQGISLLGANAN